MSLEKKFTKLLLIKRIEDMVSSGLQQIFEEYDITHKCGKYDSTIKMHIVQDVLKTCAKELNVESLEKENSRLKEELRALKEATNISIEIQDKIVSSQVVIKEEKIYEKILALTPAPSSVAIPTYKVIEKPGAPPLVVIDDEEESSEEESDEEEEEEDEEEEEESEEEEEEEEEDLSEAKEESEEAVANEESEEDDSSDKDENEKESTDKPVPDDDIESESDESDEELFEIEIDDVAYYTNNEDNGIIYKVDTEDNQTAVGYIKDGEPYFHE